MSGAGGREYRNFTEPKNRWTPFIYDKGFGYHLIIIQNKKIDIFDKANNGDILEQFTIVK